MPSLSLRSLRDALILIAAPRRATAPLLAAAALYDPGHGADESASAAGAQQSS